MPSSVNSSKSVAFAPNIPKRSNTTAPWTIQTRPTIMNLDVDEFDSVSSAKGDPTTESKTRNIVIFGDSGVGKSSLVNMLAGQKTAETSSGVLGCTFQSRQYTVTINGERVNVWDTAGLDEGTRGRVPPEVAEKNLAKLLRDLRSANGIHLLVYCIRGPSIRRSLARNYTIFYSAICRKKVPIVAVVTGLENEPVAMDNWWTKGEKELAKYKMRFDAHACVTTIDKAKMVGTVFEERILVSQETVQNMILGNCHRISVRPPSDTNVFVKAALVDFRSIMRSGWENVQPDHSVVFCQTDVTLFHAGIFGDLKRLTSQINGRSFVFQHAGDLSSRYITPKISKGGADLLIFACKSLSAANKEMFGHFYLSCGGEVCPLLVVTEEPFVEDWDEYLSAQGIGAHVVPVPSPSADGRTQSSVMDRIDELCLVRGAAKYRNTKILNFFRKTKENDAADQIPAPHD